MKKKQVLSVALAATMVAASFSACGGDKKANSDATPTTAPDNGGGTTATDPTTAPEPESKEIRHYTSFFAVPPPSGEPDDNNEIKKLLAERTGADCKETWLVGQEPKEAVGTYIASEEYPDFMEGGSGQTQLYEAGAFIPLDDLIEKYPNVKALFSPLDWEKLRQEDGHIYWLPQFSALRGEEQTAIHNYEAFWIQQRVLKWANYPKLETLDEYFKLIEDFLANGDKINGIDNIGFTMLCAPDRDFAMENPPMFLAGYPNDGACIVDVENEKVVDYNTTDVAKRYFKMMNEKFHSGVLDNEAFTQTRDEYIAKLCTGNVLGIVDQYWNFAYDVTPSLKTQGLDLQGCDYIPTHVVFDKGAKNQWHTQGVDLNVSSGIGITIDCKDPEGAMQFINDLLDQENHDLRFWGIKDVDYYVGDDGQFRRTEDQRMNAADSVYKTTHLCPYSYFPQVLGTSSIDNLNATKPENSKAEFFDALAPNVQECFNAYGAQTYVDLVGNNEMPGDWYPMWTFSNNFSSSTEGGTAWTRMKEVRQEWLPKIMMADDYDSYWNDYMDAYNAIHPERFIEELQEELERRIALGKAAAGK